MDERFKEGHRRWRLEHPDKFNEQKAMAVDQKLYALEKEIFSIIGTDPLKLKEEI